ncbi:stage III sporulation protein AF [Bacillus sp. FSL K6-3431]|uniref:stage III sporulation protein AF n=1 Tax=Bacillus sp. FSL K6-3431 TaxID=2921500 RepID=UPI0030FB09CD
MPFLSDWILNIIIFLLLAMVIDMLLPSSTMKKYAKLVIGLLLIGMILSPIYKIMSMDFDLVLKSLSPTVNENIQMQENLLEKKKREIQASQYAYTLEQLAVLMKTDVEKEMIEKFDLTISNIKISADTNAEPIIEHLKSVKVSLETNKEKTSAITPVSININESSEKQMPVDHTKILETLSARWEIPVSIIEIVPKGETEEEYEQQKRAP